MLSSFLRLPTSSFIPQTSYFIPPTSSFIPQTSYFIQIKLSLFTSTLELFFSELTSRQFDFFTQLVQIKAQVDHKHIYLIDIIGCGIKISC